MRYDRPELVEEYQLELENRIRNLLWTVSGDYSLKMKPDVSLFLRSREAALYDGIKQGAFARYYEPETVSLYLIRKIYLGADERSLTILSQLCIEEAIRERLTEERPGISSIRYQALAQLLEQDYEVMPLPTQKADYLRAVMLGDYLRETPLRHEERLQRQLALIYLARETDSTQALIQVMDRCYNEIIDPKFKETYGDLERVQSVTLEELTENGWEDYLSDELYEEALEEVLSQLSRQMTSMQGAGSREKEKKKVARTITYVTPEMQEKAHNFVELNYGKTYLSPQEAQKRNRLLCRDVHGQSRLHFTEGILKHPVKRNYQYEYALRLKKRNELLYRQNHSVVKRNVADLTALLKKALLVKNETEVCLSDRGVIVPSRLWRIGRSSEARVFQRENKADQADFVVDILMDASGSQLERQSQVALQAYMISAALSKVGLPHRVMSYCTFWDFTILHKMREYDDPASEDKGIFHYVASSNNRDGLAVKAAGYSLLQRPEEKKILIILSDGRPNDGILNRPNTLYAAQKEEATLYTGDYAVRDTASEIRKLRREGVSVLGVFHGEEADLEAERRIFGRDFAYIRRIEGFSRIVGRYLMRQLEEQRDNE